LTYDLVRQVLDGVDADCKARATPYKRDYFRASEAGKCGRQILHGMFGSTPLPFAVQGKLVVESGDLHHSATRARLRKFGIQVEGEEEDYIWSRELDGKEAYKIKARIDGRVRLRASGKGVLKDKTHALLEVKSFSVYFEKGFAKAVAAEAEEDADGYLWPRSEWSAQVIWPDYMAQTQISLEICGLDVAYFIPVFRDSGWLGLSGRGLVIPRSQDYINRILSRLDNLYRYYMAEELVEPEYQPNSRECGFCSYWGDCWGERLGIPQKRMGGDKYAELSG